MNKPLFIFLLLLLCSCCAFAQDLPRNTITATGIAQKILSPKLYRVRFVLQEDVSAESVKGVVKTLLDSLEMTFFDNLKTFGFKKNDLSVVKKSSTLYNGRNGVPVYNIVYELKDVKIEMAQKMVDGLRVGGLKGVLAKAQYQPISRPVQDSLFAAALADARINAISMASQAGKSIGEVYNITTGYVSVAGLYDYDATDIYSLSKFEISMAETRVIPVNLNVTFELKK